MTRTAVQCVGVGPIIDHIEITVRDMSVAVPFYDKLLPLLGFDLGKKGTARIDAHDKSVVSYEHPRLGFSITSPGGRSPVKRSIAGSQARYTLQAASERATDTEQSAQLALLWLRVMRSLIPMLPFERPPVSPYRAWLAVHHAERLRRQHSVLCPHHECGARRVSAAQASTAALLG